MRGVSGIVAALAGTVFSVQAIAVFSGHVVDKTTGQPLPGVRVAIGAAHATTDKGGRFALHGVRSGTATITLESSDVPLQRVTVTISAPATARDLRACSTTLDYNCGAPAAGGRELGHGRRDDPALR